MRVLDQFRLDGRVALVTGGSRGLGRAIVEALASAGADVSLCGRDPEAAASAADAIGAETGRRILAVGADVTREEEVRDLVDRTVAELGGLDILVNNAGINIRRSIEDLSLEEFEEVQRVNVRGPWLCCRAAAPRLRAAAGRGRVINVGSTLSVVGVPGRTPYASSKGAVAQMTRVLALEWAPDGVTVNTLCPGPFLTEMNRPIADEPDTRKLIVGAVPLGRWGEIHEIQGAALFLASDASSFVTGTTLFVDGGWTAH